MFLVLSDIFGKETNNDILVQEFSQSNHVSQEPPFTRAKAPSGQRRAALGTRMGSFSKLEMLSIFSSSRSNLCM